MGMEKLKWVLLKNKKTIVRYLAAAAVLAAALVLTAVFMFKSTDEEYTPAEDNGSDYAMVLQHYTDFAMSGTRTAIYLNWTNGIARLENGKSSLKLKAVVYPINLTDKTVEWQSSDSSVASIDQDGNIDVHKAGNVQFSAKLRISGKTAVAELKILQPVTGLFLPTTTVQMYTTDGGRILSARVLPEDATNTTVNWESSRPEIVSVDGNGRIKPIKAGSAVITAVTEDGGYKRNCFVRVSEATVEVSEIDIQDKDNCYVAEGDSIQLTAVPKPSNAKNRTPLKWTSDNESVASVSQVGRVKGVSAGAANITVSSTNGITDTIKITVEPSDRHNAFDLSGINTSNAADGGVTYSAYSMTFPVIVKLQMGANPPPQLWTSGGSRAASESETAEYMNPNEFYSGEYKYQFMDLSRTNGISEDALNAFLEDKGVLKNKASVFIRAAEAYGVSEVYLAAHACLETGNGTSRLASGVEYNGQTVYNIFGIGAYDSDAVGYGSQMAYRKGWTSVDEAILGGAKWISETYINNPSGRQNTLYKMLWNPENPASHQYATDISWAVKQAVSMGRIFESFPQAVFSYEVPVYSGTVPPVIE